MKRKKVALSRLDKLEAARKVALDKEGQATMEREAIDKQIQALKREIAVKRIQDGGQPNPLTVKPGDWTGVK
jgi:hypothetical protein